MDDSQTEIESREGGELSPLTIIRTETALSRFPVHRLAKKGLVQIEIKNQSTALLWEVTYNSKYGQPGPLAYKLDSLIINRRIEEAVRPLPDTIRLGSLAQIAQELGLNRDTNSVKVALLQNAFAAINAKISYRTVDRAERTLEAAFTRYAVVFTGERLPSGRDADAVYLVLHPIYADVLNAALTRPLDFDYMKTLPPAAQRFYEIASYQIYAALFYQNERAKLRYSEYCLLSTATRYLDFDHVKKQMYKVHKPHLESGYLAKVGYEETTDSAGQPDWWMYYVPGPNASREYNEFTGNIRRKGSAAKRAAKAQQGGNRESLLLPFSLSGPDARQPSQPVGLSGPVPIPSAGMPPFASDAPERFPETDGMPGGADTPETRTLISELVAADLNREVAERFARTKPDECRRQLTYLPYMPEFTSSKGAYLRRAIEQGFAPPNAYIQKESAAEAQRKKREESDRKKAVEAAVKAADAQKAAQTDKDMARIEKDDPGAFMAFLAYLREEGRQDEAKYAHMPDPVPARMRKIWDSADKRRELFRVWQKLSGEERDALTVASANPPPVDIGRPHKAQPAPRAAAASGDDDSNAGSIDPEEDPATIRRIVTLAFELE